MTAPDEYEELNYDYTPEPVIGDFDDDADAERFVRLQEKNAADAERISNVMSDKGVPDTKKPI